MKFSIVFVFALVAVSVAKPTSKEKYTMLLKTILKELVDLEENAVDLEETQVETKATIQSTKPFGQTLVGKNFIDMKLVRDSSSENEDTTYGVYCIGDAPEEYLTWKQMHNCMPEVDKPLSRRGHLKHCYLVTGLEAGTDYTCVLKVKTDGQNVDENKTRSFHFETKA